MTVISALITKDFIVAASDSLLTEIDRVRHVTRKVEFRRSKIVLLRRYRACASFWGLAKYGNWRLYEFIEQKMHEAPPEYDFQRFADFLCEQLRHKLNSFHFANIIDKGLGIHLVGYELVNREYIPELFLISNYSNTKYSEIRDLKVSRNLYETMPSYLKDMHDNNQEKQLKVNHYLKSGGYFIFNNGDPLMFNPAANTLLNLYQIALRGGKLNVEPDNRIAMKLVSSPIEFLKTFQQKFYKSESILIGGKIHRLLISNRGDFFSDTDNIV